MELMAYKHAPAANLHPSTHTSMRIRTHTYSHIHVLHPPFCAESVSELSYLSATSEGNITGNTMTLSHWSRRGNHLPHNDLRWSWVSVGKTLRRGLCFEIGKNCWDTELLICEQAVLEEKAGPCYKSSLSPFQPKYQILISKKDV